MDYTNERLGKNIRALRKKNKMTIKELAGYVDIAQSYLGLVERGNRGIRAEKLCKICELFSVSLDSIVYGELSGKNSLTARETSKGADDVRGRIDRMLNNASKNELMLVLNLLVGIRQCTGGSDSEAAFDYNGMAEGKKGAPKRRYKKDELSY